MNNQQEVEVRQGPVKVHRQYLNFASDDLERQYRIELETAQSCFLKGEFNDAMTHAGKAAKILPCAHIFGLLSAACDGLGHFDRALDFRLLQAFFSNDPVVWQELLHDCLEQKLFYKATVCLQRLSALEGKDAHRFRSLQIQLADLYIGLGEVRRGHLILLNLWKSSKFRDFEVFASLSSLFFQLGRWSSLNELVDCSLAQGFRQSKKATVAVEGEDESGVAKTRGRKRDRFMDTIHNEDKDTELGETPVVAEVKTASHESNDFDFDEVDPSTNTLLQSSTTSAGRPGGEKEDDSFSHIDLDSNRSKKNFLTLVNVQAELFNEQGKFEKALRLVVRASALLNVPVFELPPDLLLRYGVAYAYLGSKRESGEVFEHLLTTCPMSEYGDALYDAAVTLQNVGQHDEAIRIFQALRRFHLLSQQSDEESSDDDDGASLLDSYSDDAEATYQMTVLRTMSAQRKQRRQAERNAMKTTEMALTFSIGKSKAALGEDSEAYHELSSVHKMDPHHVESRILLAGLVERLGDVESAENLLIPLDKDDPCQKIVLSSELIFLLKRKERYFDACAVGVGFFELLLTSSNEDEGDKLSVVSSAASRRSKSSRLSLPTMNRATSAILPASALADMLHEAERPQTLLSSVGWKEGSKTFGLLTPSQSIAASFRSFRSSASSMAIAKRGSLTSTIAGSRAATTVAEGDGKEVDSKDTSALFSFRRKRDNALHIGKVQSQAEIDKTAKKMKSLERMGEYRKRYGRDVGMSDGGGSVGDVRELEEMERMLNDDDDETATSANNNAIDKPSRKRVRFEDDADVDESASGANEGLPSLEEIAKKRFSDPQMAALFVECTASIDNPATSGLTTACIVDEQNDPASRIVTEMPSQSELIRLLGKGKIVDVAVAVIDCYAKLGKFTEGKEFAAIVMAHLHKPMFRNSSVLELPIRLAMLRCALDGNSTEDATRMAIQVLSMNESRSTAQRNEVWEMLSRLHQIGDRTALLNRLMTDQGRRDVPLLVILGSKHLKNGSFRHALNFFLIALSQRSYDPILNFLVGITYLFVASMRVTSVKHECVTAGLFYLKAYREFVSGGVGDDLWTGDQLIQDGDSLLASLAGISGLSCATSLSGSCPKELRTSYQLLEADYNVARAFHYLSLMYLAVPMYEAVIKCGAALLDRHCVRAAEDSCRERQRSGADFVNNAADSENASAVLAIRDIKALLQLTRVNLYFIYGKTSDNYALALSTLESYP